MLCMNMQITLMNMNYRLLGFLYAFVISYYHSFASPSYARLPGALTLKLTSSQRYHVVNRLEDDLPRLLVNPLCGSPPSTTILPPPSPISGPTTGSYSPSPPVSSSPSYPTPPVPSSSSYPTPPFSCASPYTPPVNANPGSPATYQPSNGLSPPYNNEPTPPTFSFPSPTGFIPTPPLFEPPVVYPPPNGPPPPHSESESALWCVAKPSVPDPIIQEAMTYACGFGADCESLQPNGDCFQPDTLFAHASYAFNSFWQRTKVAGSTCEFGGAAMLVTIDPSYDGCHFIYF